MDSFKADSKTPSGSETGSKVKSVCTFGSKGFSNLPKVPTREDSGWHLTRQAFKALTTLNNRIMLMSWTSSGVWIIPELDHRKPHGNYGGPVR